MRFKQTKVINATQYFRGEEGAIRRFIETGERDPSWPPEVTPIAHAGENAYIDIQHSDHRTRQFINDGDWVWTDGGRVYAVDDATFRVMFEPLEETKVKK